MTNRPYWKKRLLPLLGIVPYLILLIAANLLSFHFPPDSPWQIALIVLPVTGMVIALWSIIVHLNNLDEYERKVNFDALAIAFAATAFVTFTWGFFEDVGFPKLPTFAIWPMMAVFWVLGGGIVWLRDR